MTKDDVDILVDKKRLIAIIRAAALKTYGYVPYDKIDSFVDEQIAYLTGKGE